MKNQGNALLTIIISYSFQYQINFVLLFYNSKSNLPKSSRFVYSLISLATFAIIALAMCNCSKSGYVLGVSMTKRSKNKGYLKR